MGLVDPHGGLDQPGKLRIVGTLGELEAESVAPRLATTAL
jgi:hypothetical protein